MVTSKIISVIEKEKEITYPCLMNLIDSVNHGLNYVVMFTSLNCGVVVLTDYKEGSPESINMEKLGTYSNSWTECTNKKIWYSFTGTIALKNS